MQAPAILEEQDWTRYELLTTPRALAGAPIVLADSAENVHEVQAGKVAERLACDTKTVDNALQRVKRKVGAHLASRAVPL